MKYIIMAAGAGTRWNNYLGIPKHLIEINGETLLGRTTRLLKENGATDYIITCANNCYAQYGLTMEQSYHDCEIDRFEEINTNEPICYLYGDVYYTENAIKTIVNTPTDDVLYFGHEWEIFAIKIVNKKFFYDCKKIVKNLYLTQQIHRCIGWEIYRCMNNLPYEEHHITNRYVKILDGTDDIDYPYEYEEFIRKLQPPQEKISIIIPYYKTYDLTKNLIEELNKQRKGTNTELILVDDSRDGDKLSKMVDIYIKNPKNLGGPGSRNVGLDAATGDYIVFIDCDDKILENYAFTIIEEAKKHNDLTWLSWDSTYGQAIVNSTKQINIAPWGCLFKKRIFENIRFNNKLNVGEENEFWEKVFKIPDLTIGFSKNIIYYYNIRKDSLTRRYDRGEVSKERGN